MDTPITFEQWLEDMKEQVQDPQVDLDTHEPTENELNNICYLSMKYIAGWPMRQADLKVVEIMGGEITTVRALDDKWIPNLADYIWDHLMGEPETISSEQITEGCKAVCNLIYGMPEEIREAVVAQ